MSWFTEIFEANSDKARLIAILISAVLALIILLANQWFNNRRAKKELAIKKIEELYLASIEYTSACRDLLGDLTKKEFRNEHGDFNPDHEKLANIGELVRKMEMLSHLHFPSAEFHAGEYIVPVVMPIIEIAEKSKYLPEGEAHSIYEDSRDNITAAGKRLGDMCSQLMNEHRH